MKSFRLERQKKSSASQVLTTILILLLSIVLIRLFPADPKEGNPETNKTIWESSVIKLP